MVEELMQYMAFCCAVEKNKEATIGGKLAAVNVYHDQWVGLSLPISHVRVRAVRQGVKGTHGQRRSTAGKETINAGDAGRDGRWQLRLGSRGKSDVGRTGAYMFAAAEGARVVRGGEWSILRSILPTEGGRGVFPGGIAIEKRARKKRRTRWKSDLKGRKGVKEGKERYW